MRGISFILLTALSSGVLAAEPVASANTSAAQTSLIGQLAQLGLGLVLVVGLIFLMGYLMRRVGPLAAQGGQHIRIVSNLPLGPRDRLILVDVGGKQMLLGASPGRISTLHVFEEPVAEIPLDTVDGDFARKLQALLKRENRP